MPRRRRRSTIKAVKDINITPLMDLTFLLLIVFMITAPMLEYEIDVSPPKMISGAIDEERSLMVNLTAKGKIILEKETIDLEELTRRLAVLGQAREGTTVLIRADGARPYREVISIMKAVRAANIENVSLVTQPEDEA